MWCSSCQSHFVFPSPQQTICLLGFLVHTQLQMPYAFSLCPMRVWQYTRAATRTSVTMLGETKESPTQISSTLVMTISRCLKGNLWKRKTSDNGTRTFPASGNQNLVQRSITILDGCSDLYCDFLKLYQVLAHTMSCSSISINLSIHCVKQGHFALKPTIC